MCLKTVTKELKKPDQRVRKVWKYFKVDNNGDLTFPCIMLRGTWLVTRGVWLRATEVVVYYGLGEYQAGFHCYTEVIKTSYPGRIVLPVYVAEVHTWGRQRHENNKPQKVVVARWLYVPKGDEKPPKLPVVKPKTKPTPTKKARKYGKP